MKNIKICIAVVAILLLTQCASAPEGFKVKFDNTKEVSGKKFAIRDINPDLPRDWDEYHYVVLEFKITTAQRFQVGFTSDNGYNELRVMSYLPNAWNKLAIPLRFYTNLPDPKFDVARTNNQPRFTGWINLGGGNGNRGVLHGVDSIGIRMRVPIGNPEFEIRNITLAVDDPGDEYIGTIPVVDEFGQHNLVDFPEKIRSLEQLQAEWAAEDKELETSAPDYNYSKYGGYLQKQVKATGFFRTEMIDGRWWYVDPEGYLFLSVGVNGGGPGGGGTFKELAKRGHWLKETPPEQFKQTNNQGMETVNFATWNLFRRYGEDYRTKGTEKNSVRMDRWGINVGTSAMAQSQQGKQKPYINYLRLGLELQGDLMGLADVYAPNFATKVDSSMKASLPKDKDNPWIIGYFVGNEPAWIRQEVRLCNLILDGPDRPIKTALQKFLKNGDTPERKKEFIHTTFNTFLQTVKKTMKRYDPNHLILGIRFAGLPNDESIMNICRNAFDVVSVNAYDLAPSKEMLDRALRMTGLPVMIGEYHFGTVDRGMAQSLWQVYNQEDRGVAYRYYTEQGYSHPALIGTSYFIWTDQDLMGRTIDGENYNCGIIDVTDRPYKYQVEAMMETAKRLYAVHSGEIEPFDQTPLNARGSGRVPDQWDTDDIWEGYDWLRAPR